MTEERKKLLHPTSEALAEVYKALYKKGEVSFPLHDEHLFKLDSIVKTVNAEYFGFVRFPTNEEKAAAYFCYIIKDHPVTDGNKRLAVLWLDVFCQAKGLHMQQIVSLDELAVSVEYDKEISLEEMIHTVRGLLFGFSGIMK